MKTSKELAKSYHGEWMRYDPVLTTGKSLLETMVDEALALYQTTNEKGK